MTQRKRAPQLSQPNALLEAALAYAERGWHVLPLTGKRPRLPNGWHGASADREQIERWWERWPDANVGIACALSGLLVVDVDEGGEETVGALVTEHGRLPETVEARTGGGGRHLFFAAENGLDVPGRLGPHVDLRHRHYVVAPPSVHPETGALYEWADGAGPNDRDPTLAPIEWIAAAVAHKRGAAEYTGDDWTVPEHERHDAMVSIAGTLRHNLALTPEEIGDALRMLSERGRFGDAPLDREQHIDQIVRSIDWAPGQVPWEYRFPNGKQEKSESRPSRLELLTLADALVASEEAVDWVVPDLLAAGEKVVIAGPPKSLKTWMALHLMRSVAVGETVLGEQAWNVERIAPVLFVQEEGSKQRWAQRIAATFEGATDAPFFYTHRGGFSLRKKNNVDWVIENALRTEARLIVIDPWQRVTPGIKENDASDTGRAWDAVHRIASETGAAVVVVHHANKGGGEPNMDSIRGSSRMAGEVDLIVVVRKKERGQLEVFLDGRDLVRDDDGGNLAVEYEGDHPHRMRAVGFAVNAQGVEGATRPAVLKVLGRASERLSTSDVRVAVAEQLGETRTRQAVTQELQALADGGTVVKHASGKGKTAYWELDV